MPSATNKRSTMALYLNSKSIYGHRVRIVLAEKDVPHEIIYVTPENQANFLHLAPYNTLPILTDRDLILYETKIITEYLDERFPHPPLMPVYPVAKAKTRLIIHQIEQNWLPLITQIEQNEPGQIDTARQQLLEEILAFVPLFSETQFLLNDEFSLADCCVAPILWRLSHWQIQLPNQAKPLKAYMQRVFDRASFQASLAMKTEEPLEII